MDVDLVEQQARPTLQRLWYDDLMLHRNGQGFVSLLSLLTIGALPPAGPKCPCAVSSKAMDVPCHAGLLPLYLEGAVNEAAYLKWLNEVM